MQEAPATRGSSTDPTRALPPALGWVLLGLAGSVLLTLAGSRLGGGTVTWWFDLRILATKEAQRALFYVGVAALLIGWLGLGRTARAGSASPAMIATVAALWSLPLALGVPLFSRDIYSYLAQGTIAHLGLNPYHAPPTVLAQLGHGHVLGAVDPFWRHATAPYGPLFVGVISLIVAVTGSHLVVGAIAVRVFDLVGLLLLAVFVPRLARRMGSDPTRAVWLTVASPLVLLQLVAPAHNDLLMAGVMVAGVTLALDRHWLIGVVVCALAATIKLPALAAVGFVAVCWIREQTTWRERLNAAAQALAGTVATLGLVTLVTGFGTGWISTALFSTPARVRLAITPATDISWTLAKALHDLGAAVTFGGVEPVLRSLCFAASVILALVLLAKVRRKTLVLFLGWTLVAFAVGGPALWPWYLTWGLALLATWGPAQRSRLLVVAILVASVLVKPGGILALPRQSSPIVVGVWLVLIATLWLIWRRRNRSPTRASLAPAR